MARSPKPPRPAAPRRAGPGTPRPRPLRVKPAPRPAPPPPLRSALLAWYRLHHRKLPWRAPPGQLADPYHEWLSEAMLQQTQVATVVAYFERFVRRFPTLAALAGADEQSVLREWQGLGYYRRARHLHAAAKAVVAQHGGRLPDSAAALLALPGLGRYSAGAIASIAFGRREPAVDGNVARVLARWFALVEPIDAPAVRARLWRLAGRLVPTEHPGDFNQALMELGATICTPRAPRCGDCPVAAVCRARRLDLVGSIPARAPRRRPRDVEHHVLAIQRRGELALVARPDSGLWSGMWEMPTLESLDPGADPAPALKALAARLGLRVATPTRVGAFDHQTTHLSIRFAVWRTTCTGGRLVRGQWRAGGAVDDLPLPNPQRRAMRLIAQGEAPGGAPAEASAEARGDSAGEPAGQVRRRARSSARLRPGGSISEGKP